MSLVGFYLSSIFNLNTVQPANYQLKSPPKVEIVTPAPLYRDPIYDGAADPVLVYHPQRKAWWMLYTQRRANLNLPGVAWCHGTEIGIAESADQGLTWRYVGQLPLSHPDSGYSFWAPDIVRDDNGVYHLFVSYVPGDGDKHVGWDGNRYIFRYTSKDLWSWKYEQRLPTDSDHCIDPSLCRLPDGTWRVWYKDESARSSTFALESKDLTNWKKVPDPSVSKLYGEGPKVFQFQGSYWLIKDPDSGLDVYKSSDLTRWTYQGKILQNPGNRPDDSSIGKHADVVVCSDRAYIIYFTHPNGQDYPEKNGLMQLVAKRTSIQAAELKVEGGNLTCNRNAPFRIRLTPSKN
jgi:sucrose-6-phosphate hydrolase SacC (GH32 family)